MNREKNKGQILVYVLVFGFAFLIVIFGLLELLTLQYRQANQEVALETAFDIAEAGINYFQWCLNNEKESQCKGTKDYYDIFGKKIGKFELTVQSVQSCGQTIQQTVISVGYTNKYPNLKRKIKAVFARPSVAYYSYILNSDVWIGPDHEIKGPYHSNGGIRMDGENQSIVSSAKKDWICDKSFNCSPCPSQCRVENNQCYCPGVFTTANGNSSLFQFPVPNFDFQKITVDLAQLKTIAQHSGIYLPPSSKGKGYHLIFSGKTLEVREIRNLSATYAYSYEEGWHYDYFTITSERTLSKINIPSDCSVIFVEDDVWPEGKISGSLLLASANLINSNIDTSIILQGNIEYLDKNKDSFAVIAENNILISPNSPNNMELDGIFIAQKGRFGRNYYEGNYREKLEIFGSIVSNGRVGTKWIDSNTGIWTSGYRDRETKYDLKMVYCAPPFTPAIEPNFRLISWQEE